MSEGRAALGVRGKKNDDTVKQKVIIGLYRFLKQK